MKRRIPILLSIISIAVSIIALCCALPSNTYSFDYMGILVGILAILVTVLIAWQIYTFIDIKNKSEDLDKISKGTFYQINQMSAVNEHTFWMIYHQLLLGKDPLGLEYRFLYHGVACLYQIGRAHV